MDFFKKLAGVVTGLAPILAGVASMFFPQVAIASKVFTALPSLIAGAETIFGAGTGAIKKEYVLSAVQTGLSLAGEFSSGGQKETLDDLLKKSGTMIDLIVAGTKAVGVEWEDSNATISAG